MYGLVPALIKVSGAQQPERSYLIIVAAKEMSLCKDQANRGLCLPAGRAQEPEQLSIIL
jgi:hypothetical protein